MASSQWKTYFFLSIGTLKLQSGAHNLIFLKMFPNTKSLLTLRLNLFEVVGNKYGELQEDNVFFYM